MLPLEFLLIVLTYTTVNPRTLTTEENNRNSRICGVHFLGERVHPIHQLTKKSYGGRKFQENEYPWTVILTMKNPDALCSGVQISPRHILTAAHCVLAYDPIHNYQECLKNRSFSAVSVMRQPEEIIVYISGNKTDCNNPMICPSHKASYNVVKITAHNYDHCGIRNDLSVIELARNISESYSTPICMPSEHLQLSRVLYASGSGMDRQQVVAQMFRGVDDISHIIVTETFAKGISLGDSGGPLFQVSKTGIHTLVGITNSLPMDRSIFHPKNKNILAFYADVRAHLDWICKHSGVCPIEDEAAPKPDEDEPPVSPQPNGPDENKPPVPPQPNGPDENAPPVPPQSNGGYALSYPTILQY